MKLTPLSAIADLGSALIDLITASLPTKEQQLEKFKLRHPVIYSRIRKRMVKNAAKFLKANPNVLIEDWVEFSHGDLPETERLLLINIIKSYVNKEASGDKNS